ncbi:MAG TPA: hypothetical protein V6D19_01770 [Stenomitos sp.]
MSDFLEPSNPSAHNPVLPYWIEVYKTSKKWVLIRRTGKEVLSPSDTIMISGPFRTAEEAHQWARDNIPPEFKLCTNNKKILTKNDRLKLANVFKREKDDRKKREGQTSSATNSGRSVNRFIISALMYPTAILVVCILGLISYVVTRINHQTIEERQVISSKKNSFSNGMAHGEIKFDLEASRAASNLSCVASDIILPEVNELGKMYFCISGTAQTVKFYLNEDVSTGNVKNAKFVWNDWFKDVGSGIHADYMFANSMIDTVLTLYPSQYASRIKQAFFANENRNFETDSFMITYTYERGSAIDERMLVITPKPRIEKPSIQ